ncbi:MAG TPA: amidohydrolase family protein [Candidatus Dormibacteraeota bacterium]|nr:amidohydrolase family protein [Candidatus Dormibacteraeota bacterium]
MIVDAHHHFWDPAHAHYPWMAGDSMAPIRRAFGPDDLRPLLKDAGIRGSVLVQTRSSLAETIEFLAVAAVTDFVAGVVGWVDLTDPNVGRTIGDLKERPGGRFLVGIRHQVHDEADEAWLRRQDVRRGLLAVEAAGLTYDLLVKTPQLPAALDVARALPRLQFVIDHIAKPRIVSGREDPAWAEAMAPFSELPNVSCKLSGLVTEADWTTWTAQDLEPYVRKVAGWFGEDRLMFGSDWPVCLLAASYTRVVEALRQALGEIPDRARRQIMGGTAVHVYRLAVGTTQ